MIGRLHHLILDAADPQRSAAFWSALLQQPITYDDGDFVVVSADSARSGMAFQRSADQLAPTWPQQMHVDVMVENPAEARDSVIALGATHLRDNVYADPAGHPFCLVRRPGWAPPLE